MPGPVAVDEAAVTAALEKHFGHTSFRSEDQRSAVMAVLRGASDVFVSMPTGSGKSLVYQGCYPISKEDLIMWHRIK